MVSFFNIYTIARFESKILFRGWFFRIVAILSIIILGFINAGMVLKNTGFNWTFVALPSFQPYSILMMFNLLQAVLAIFLSSDFARRDKNFDTSKVIYTRSMSNTEYVWGKTLGILYVFLVFNILVVLETAIFNLTTPLIKFHALSYAVYPLLISFPTVIFIIGLSYLFMTLTKNQAITFILLVAYVALTSFYLGNKLNYLLDFMAYRVPMAYSDFIGFGNLPEILLHRGIYVLLGIGFMFLSIRFMDRLPQSKSINLSLVAAILFIGAGLVFSAKYLTNIKITRQMMEQALALNDTYFEEPVVDVDHYDLMVKHKLEKMEIKAKVRFHNPERQSLEKYIFSLNNGLKLVSVEKDGQKLPFKREMHIIIVEPASPLAPGASDNLTFTYEGKPDERTTYLDADSATMNEQFRLFMLNVDPRSCVVSSDYVILTHACNWYPIAGVGYSQKDRFRPGKDFATYTLDVDTRQRFTAISQGKESRPEKGRYVFDMDIPIPQASLTIGPYEKLSVTIDSVEYALYRKKDHKYWTQHLTEIGDTLQPVLAGLIEDFERKLGLEYPFNKAYLVEAPIQFGGIPRLHTVAWEYSQPEIIFIPENGFMLFSGDFRQMENSSRKRDKESDLSEKEKQVNRFKLAFNSTIANGTSYIRSPQRQGEISNYYSLFPLYYTHVYDIHSKDYPIMDLAFESYLMRRIRGNMETWATRGDGLSGEEKANLYLQKGSLEHHLKNEKNRDMIMDIIGIKSEYLFTVLRYNQGTKAFDAELAGFLDKKKHKRAYFKDFAHTVNNHDQWDLDAFVENWYSSNKLPTYAFDLGEYYTVMKDNKEMNQVIFRITNHSETDGFFTVTFEQKKQKHGWGVVQGYGIANELEYIYKLDAGQTKEIGLVLDEKFRSFFVNTITSNNLPQTFNRLTQKFEEKEAGRYFEGEAVLDKPVAFAEDNEMVVDNLDEGFKLEAPTSDKLIRKLFEDKDDDEFEYVNFNWQPQSKWQHFTHSELYGKTIHSAYYCKPGKGDFKASWTVPLELGSGKYEVHAFVVGQFVNHNHGRGRHRNRDGSYGSFIYTVEHDDGAEDVPVVLKELEHGWNYLGDFYFSGDSARVVLTNKGEPPMIITADAMKWVKK
jgi:ABC-type transport system involved in multi-copper enzyme maturation permease subunit